MALAIPSTTHRALAVREPLRTGPPPPPRREPVVQVRRIGFLDAWRAQGVAAYGAVELPPRVLDAYA